ncbi:hypothetical protein [Allofournierella massiliensis]|uniref:hypothetical protein n=1 Tax=Allofournierella massiliensis TaxID=1650663 RepID=UPI0012E36B4B|nr:hypothetical protein [Fournierella massiliensis]
MLRSEYSNPDAPSAAFRTGCSDTAHSAAAQMFPAHLPECKVFQHAHVVFCAVPFVQCFQPFTRVYGTFKAKGFLACAFLNGAVPAGFSFSAMAASIAGKPLALIGLAQSAIHSAGRHKLL